MGQPKIPGGYINLSRSIVESEIFNKPPLYMKVWIYLLTRAQHKQYKGLKRGQLYTNVPEIVEACSWKVGFRKEKPDSNQVYKVIEWLRKKHEEEYEKETKSTMITTMRATQGLLITIDNYCFYQDAKNYESNNEYTNEQNTIDSGRQSLSNNTNKNVNNERNKNNKLYLINNEDEHPEDIEQDFKSLCNDYFNEFSVGRWTKEQWLTLVNNYVSELMKEKRFINIKRKNRRSYVYNSLKNIAYKHDLRHKKNQNSEGKDNDFSFQNFLYGEHN